MEIAVYTIAKNRYGLKAVGLMYEQYFNRLLTLWENGWYQLKD
jgi:hypothetical protein